MATRSKTTRTGVDNEDVNVTGGKNTGDNAGDIETSSSAEDDVAKDPDFVVEGISNKRGKFSCHNCPYVAKHRHHLEQHIRVHHPFKCDSCSLAFSARYSLEIHMRKHKVKHKVCLLRLRSEKSLASDMRGQCGELPFKCSQCTSAFTNKQALTVHEATHATRKP